MSLKELSELWGIPTVRLLNYGKKYRLLSSALYIGDIVLMLLCVSLLYKNGSSFHAYIIILVLICVFVNLWFNYLLSPEKWLAYKFYNKYKDHEVEIKSYDLNETNVASILYCLGDLRAKTGKEGYFKEKVLSLCGSSRKFPKRVMKYISKYISECGCKIYVLTDGKSEYFVGFVNEEEKESKS